MVEHRRGLTGFAVLIGLVAVVAALISVSFSAEADDARERAPLLARQGRVVFVMVDSLSASLAEDPKSFPTLASLRPRALWGRLAGCLPASTVPCVRTMLEGNAAGYLASLNNFAARQAPRHSFPVIASERGLRVAVASDHTFNRMLEGVPSSLRLDYAPAKVPVLEWDEAAVVRVEGWLAGSTADVLLVHLVDLDKASHSPGPGSARYREQVRGADTVLARIAALLTAKDTLIVAGDHGHDEFGNHTPDPGYLAVGPVFQAQRLDLRQPTMALLLSAAAATPLPAAYEGEVPSQAFKGSYLGSPALDRELQGHVTKGRMVRLAAQRTIALLNGVALLVALALLAILWVPRRDWQRWCVLGGLIGAGLLSFAIGASWASFGRSALWVGPPVNLLHYALFLLLVATPVALFVRRLGAAAAESSAAGLLAFPLLVDLTGDDYFAPGRMCARFLAPASLLLLWPALKQRDRQSAITALSAIALAVVIELAPARSGELADIALTVLGACLLWTAARDRPGPLRAVLTLLLIVLALIMKQGGTAALVIALGGLAARGVLTRAGTTPLVRGLFGAALVSAVFRFGLTALRFEKVRFEFAISQLPTIANEALLATLVVPMTLVKYLLVVALPLSSVSFRERPDVARSCCAWLAGQALLASAFVAGATFAANGRYQETAIEEACLYAVAALLAVVALIVDGSLRSTEDSLRLPQPA